MPVTGPKIIKVDPYKFTLKEIKEVVTVLNQGGVIILPTDTVYGIGASIRFPQAMEKIYQIKKRPQEKPLPILIASWHEASRIAGRVTQRVRLWMKEYWPGALTFVLYDRSGKKVGLRVPDLPLTLKILQLCGPIAMTSANLSGRTAVRDFDKISRDCIRSVDAALDAGPCPLGKSRPWSIYRVPNLCSFVREEDSSLLRPNRLLFVCTGNTCRSVMAELLTRRLIREKGWNMEIRSAGIAGHPSYRIYGPLEEIFAEEDLDYSRHRSTRIDEEMIAWAELILVMELAQKKLLLRRFPQAAGKVFLLTEIAGEEGDVEDPVGQSKDVYRAIYDKIEKLIRKIIRQWEE